MKARVSLFLLFVPLIFAVPSLSESAPVKATLFAVLSGGNEVDANGVAVAGDADGRGSATVIVEPSRHMICFAIVVTGIGTPIAAHIHRAPAGVNGDIEIGLTAPTGGNPGAASGCVTGVATPLLNAIVAGPSGFYINVHTQDLQGGAVRGQLF